MIRMFKGKLSQDSDLLMKYFLIAEVIIAILIIMILLGSITFGKNGFVNFCKLKIQITKKHSEIQELALKNYELTRMINALKEEEGFEIEKIAREKLMLIKPGEVVYLIPTEN